MFTPSIQQAAFFKWINEGKGSCILEAVAGSGKTTTLIESLKLMKGAIFFGAYNKKIADELQARAPQSMGLTISTMHAAGLKAWGKSQRSKVNADKCRDIFRSMTFGQFEYGILEGPVLQLVGYAKQAAVGVKGFPAESDMHFWQHLIDHFDVETFDEARDRDNTETIIMLARRVLASSIQMVSVIDFDDMIYMPLVKNNSIDKKDWVLIDEAQDTNASRRELSLRMLKPNGRLVAVGDRRQAIYAFTGADADSLDLIGNAVNAVQMPLTVTYRCPKEVVKYAQQWVSHIQAHESAPAGIVRTAEIEKLYENVKVGDAILCRFNAPLIKHVYQLIAKGIPARVEGREIGAGLKALANRWKVKSIDALIEKLEDFLEREVQKFTEKDQPRKIQDITDKVQCLLVIIDRVIQKGAITKPPQLAVAAEIDAIFGGDDKKPVVLLCSIHRAKGMEWNTVIWLQTPPSPYAKQEYQQVQEQNLQYVAATRAKKVLVLISI